MKAVQLFEEARRLPPKDQPGYISMRLHEALAGSPISVWRRGESIPGVGRRMLVGIAPYSLPDLELLDAIKEALKQKPSCEERVQVFDVLTCASMKDFDECIPGIGQVYQTPVVGVWEDGVLVQKASGAKARQLTLEQYKVRT